MTRLLVVDASVVQSAGKTEHQMSSSCRNCLEEIRLICHRVVVTPDIRDEWNRHMSRFSRKWKRSMAARRKLLQVVNPTEINLDISSLSDKERVAVKKDRCLLEAALSADCVIVTRDDAFRAALAKTPQGVDLLKRITWINPVSSGVNALQGL